MNGKPIVTTLKKNAGWLLNQADSITRDSNDLYDCIFKTYHIKKAWFMYCNQDLLGFDIVDNQFAFSVNGKQVRIGDNKEALKPVFPLAYASDYAPKSDTTIVTVPVMGLDYQMLNFTVDEKGVIVEVSMITDYD